jgi:response regulator RpfG family c-di-GMP phosphodiesterase
MIGLQMSATDKILLVDDEPNILAAYARVLRGRFRLETALGSAKGLEMVSVHGPYSVIVSDLRMPGMDGIEFLTRSREKSPDTVRMLLTGNVDVKAAIEAVNQGCIFRFLTKPCLPNDFSNALQAGIDQYRLIFAERELLQNTLNGSIRVLTEILSIVDPESFGKGNTLRDLIHKLARAMEIADTWELELGAMLAQIGHVTIPPSILIKEKTGEQLSEIEEEMIARAPQTGHNLLANIPRLKSVADMVLYQNKHFNGDGFPKNQSAGAQIPIGARLLKVLKDMTLAETDGMTRSNALEAMRKREGWYDPAVLDAACLCFAPELTHYGTEERADFFIAAKDLKVGQILLSDVLTGNGTLLIKAGNFITVTILERIRNFSKLNGVCEPIHVELLQYSAPMPRRQKPDNGSATLCNRLGPCMQ